MNKKRLLTIAAGAAMIGAYRAITGKGAFNRVKFSKQHEAVGSYVLSHHPGTFYSPIERTKDGWSCVINDRGTRYLLFIFMSEDGIYIFDENKIE